MIPTLSTERLTLGAPRMTDITAFIDFCRSDRSIWFGGPTDDPRDGWDSCLAATGQWTLRGYGAFFARDADGAPVGRIALRHPIDFDEPELAYVLYTQHEGQGLAYEAVAAVRDWAHQQGLGPLMSLIARANSRSIALATRLGCHVESLHSDGDAPVDLWRHPA